MSSLEKLKLATSLTDVAGILGYKPSSLSYLLYKLPAGSRYTTFTIPKKGGGVREICAPSPKLKALQRKLADILYECCVEIEQAHKQPRSLSHAFRKSHSILTNARPHKNRRYVLNLDLKDFFPSLNFGRVRGFFLKNKDFKLHAATATVLAQIACNGDTLPQGSPCSPIISELLTHFLDVRLAQLAKKEKCTYSRYADDITFSTNKKTLSTAIAVEEHGVWSVGKELNSRVSDAGFTINHTKTRLQYRGSRQIVTGLTVNEKVNIRANYYRTARAMAHSLLSTGQYHRADGVAIKTVEPIEGIFSHIYYVKQRWADLEIIARGNEVEKKEWIENKYDKPISALKLYRLILFYKLFVNLDKPLIVCEGKTDGLYLKSAIRSLTKFHPKLATIKKGEMTFNVKFLRYGPQIFDILRLGGGTGDLKRLLLEYPDLVSQIKHTPLKQPVILLIDNDDGAKPVFSAVKSKFHVTAELKTTLPFYHLCHNLFLIKTEEKGTSGISRIEDCFLPSVLATKLEGKSFNPSDKIDPATEYGKAAFAEKVVRPDAGKIDFSQFTTLLDRMVSVIDEYT